MSDSSSGKLTARPSQECIVTPNNNLAVMSMSKELMQTVAEKFQMVNGIANTSAAEDHVDIVVDESETATTCTLGTEDDAKDRASPDVEVVTGEVDASDFDATRTNSASDDDVPVIAVVVSCSGLSLDHQSHDDDDDDNQDETTSATTCKNTNNREQAEEFAVNLLSRRVRFHYFDDATSTSTTEQQQQQQVLLNNACHSWATLVHSRLRAYLSLLLAHHHQQKQHLEKVNDDDDENSNSDHHHEHQQQHHYDQQQLLKLETLLALDIAGIQMTPVGCHMNLVWNHHHQVDNDETTTTTVVPLEFHVQLQVELPSSNHIGKKCKVVTFCVPGSMAATTTTTSDADTTLSIQKPTITKVDISLDTRHLLSEMMERASDLVESVVMEVCNNHHHQQKKKMVTVDDDCDNVVVDREESASLRCDDETFKNGDDLQQQQYLKMMKMMLKEDEAESSDKESHPQIAGENLQQNKQPSNLHEKTTNNGCIPKRSSFLAMPPPPPKPKVVKAAPPPGKGKKHPLVLLCQVAADLRIVSPDLRAAKAALDWATVTTNTSSSVKVMPPPLALPMAATAALAATATTASSTSLLEQQQHGDNDTFFLATPSQDVSQMSVDQCANIVDGVLDALDDDLFVVMGPPKKRVKT